MAASHIKRLIKTLLKRFDIDISRYRPQADKWVAHKILLQGTHAPLILDVGANIGQTLQAYKDIFPDCEIHCFEPFPDSYSILKQTTSNYKHAHAHHLAISDSIGERALYVNSYYHVTNSLYPRPTSGARYYPEGAQLNDVITVQTDTLDSFCQRFEIGNIDILKMDIQGGELAALHGASKMLDNQTPRLITTEIMFIPHYEGGALFHEINDYLLSKGYSLFGIYDLHYAENGQLRFADAIYINGEMRNALK